MFDLVIGTLLSSFCNFVAQHIYTELFTKPGEVKYPQVRLNPVNICQRRRISADFFRSAQSVHFLAPEHLNHSATPPKRPIFYTYMSLCCTCICARVLFRSMFVARLLYSQPRPPPPLRPFCPLLPLDRCPAQSRKSRSTPSPQSPDHPHIAQLTFLTLRETTQAEPSLSSGSLHQQQNCRVALRLLVQPLPASAWAGCVRRACGASIGSCLPTSGAIKFVWLFSYFHG